MYFQCTILGRRIYLFRISRFDFSYVTTRLGGPISTRLFECRRSLRREIRAHACHFPNASEMGESSPWLNLYTPTLGSQQCH
jgi:hypothetical protein